jgi:hypothetical protein
MQSLLQIHNIRSVKYLSCLRHPTSDQFFVPSKFSYRPCSNAHQGNASKCTLWSISASVLDHLWPIRQVLGCSSSLGRQSTFRLARLMSACISAASSIMQLNRLVSLHGLRNHKSSCILHASEKRKAYAYCTFHLSFRTAKQTSGYNSVRRVMWTPASCYEELNILVTRTYPGRNCRHVPILFSVPSQLIRKIYAVHMGI